MSNNFKVFPIENSPGFIMHHLDLLLKLGLHKAFQAEGINITAEQWAILSCLWEKEGIHQSAIAVKIGKDRHTITRMLNLLEKKGFIKRVPTNEDKRRLNVYLTDSGKEIRGTLVPIVTGFLERAFIGLTREEITESIRILRHITGNLESLKA
ncbi:MarR family winged helix-turn-helix transcriptional regulator [Dethiosulfatarculus sandiegensis]|uniref:MarR family transcriptional regulator n=1 Tax=Dethiosulfatarculus sandiegensis TaxID=1429043 RepID=A0A0D2GDE7_9BACT|nr:MarR family transcriptional regulator [Dethiosulfatarculus sandiegensis]KIX12972.1 MarR family transcriptional regulator [Dethiosulfatarculus sandiegensis]